MVTHPTKRSGVALNQALELMAGILPAEFESWDEVPDGYRNFEPEFELLRTPAASEAERGHQPEEKAKARGGQVTLSGQINFLPTPTVGNHNESGHCRDWGGDLTHSLTCYCNKFGRFEPAIRRWEQITSNKAPEPTKPDGKDGNPRLSSEFTEWMMGLEPGWITSVGLSRKDQLKACGNGVVPQQAKLALTILLDRVGSRIEMRPEP
jgi:DNA (cytosine-5)-methyltransferase 1